MKTIVDEIRERLREEVCSVCVHEMEGGGCSLEDKMACPVLTRTAELVRIIECPEDVRHEEHLAQVRNDICTACRQDAAGNCEMRDGLECPLSLYYPVIEEVIVRTLAEHGLKPAEVRARLNAS
jgi:hypothetical protein